MARRVERANLDPLAAIGSTLEGRAETMANSLATKKAFPASNKKARANDDVGLTEIHSRVVIADGESRCDQPSIRPCAPRAELRARALAARPRRRSVPLAGES